MPFIVNDPGHVAEHNRLATALPASVTAVAPLASPAFTGSPTAPTPPVGDSSGNIATTEFVAAGFVSQPQLPSLRIGTRLAVLGDSTCRGVYSGDSQPGVDGSTIYVAANSWLTWAAILSGGRIVRFNNAGVIGNTIAMMDARVLTDVIESAYKPQACIVYSGYNDAYNNVTPDAYMTSLRSIVGKLLANGIAPILVTPLPTANNATIGGLLVSYAQRVRTFGAANGYPVLDFQQWTTDPTDGGLIAAVKTGGDGVHPSAAGQKWLGQKVSDTLTPLLTPDAIDLQYSPLDTSTLITNGLVTGTPSSGVAPGYFVFGSVPAGVTNSVTTDPQVPGNMQTATHASSTTAGIVASRISSGYSPGDVLEISGVVTTSGIPASVAVQFYTAPYGNEPISFTQDVTRGVFSARVQVPSAATTGYIDVELSSGPGSGTASFGQLTVRNVTTLHL